MSAKVRDLTADQFRKLMGVLPPDVMSKLIRALGRNRSWAPFQNQPDDFGPSLYKYLVNNDRLSARQVNAARVYLMPRNMGQIVELIAHDRVEVDDSWLEMAQLPTTPLPTYKTKAQQDREAQRAVARTRQPTPAAPAPRRRSRRRRRRQPVATPQQQREAAQRAKQAQDAADAELEREMRAAAQRKEIEQDASVLRFLGLDLDEAPPHQELPGSDDDDPSVQRFRMLDLD